MIVKDTRNHWVANLFIFRGSALQRIWRRLLFTTLVAGVVTFLDLELGGVLMGEEVELGSTDHIFFHEDLTKTPFTLVGLALGIFLGFRNNTSYDRFWEGRKLWGRMVNVSRTFTRQILTLIGPQPYEENGVDRSDVSTTTESLDSEEVTEFHQEMVRRTAAYVHAFRMHLRDEFDPDFLKKLLPAEEVDALQDESNRPIAILQTLGDKIREAWLKGWVHSHHVRVLEESLTEMTGVQGACERIKATPIPFSYTVLIHRLVAVYCFALPFGIVNETLWYTPVVVLIVAYAFFGLDAVGDEIEDPFGKDPNDLPLTGLSTMIERNIRQRIGDEDLPELLKPVDDLLQ